MPPSTPLSPRVGASAPDGSPDYRGEVPTRRRAPETTAPAARSLADEIRSRTDDELVELVVGRPDLARPAPADLTSLAARASTRASVQRCLETLDRGQLQVLEAAVVAGEGTDPTRVAALLGASADPDRDVRPVLEQLRTLALLWRGGDGLNVVRTVPEVLGPTPAGLGPAAADLHSTPAAGLTDAHEIRRLVAEAPPGARAVLDRLAWGPPVGVVGGGTTGSASGGPVLDGPGWLLERGLLARVALEPTALRSGADPGDIRVVLPRDVAIVLRGGRIHSHPALTPPPAQTTALAEDVVDATAAGVVVDLLTHVEELVIRWGASPPRVLRTGGLSVRDLRVVGTSLELPAERAAFVVEVAYAAGLVADDGELAPVWAPTAAADRWQTLPAGARWEQLAAGWLASMRATHLVGGRDPSTTTPGGAASSANALGPDVQWPAIRGLRAEVLGELATCPGGQVPTAGSVVERLLWRRPLRNPRMLREAAAAVLREAEWLGVTGRGALSCAGRALVTRAGDAGAAMGAALPDPVDHVLLQADLTAIAPGPLEGDLAHLMRLVSDVESRGGATVHRLSPTSVRRALDVGWTADELLERLRDASRTGVPQPLEYLVRDLARRHGQTRVGAATAYIRSDDEAVLETMVAERSLGALRLRRIAPTVVISGADPATMLEMLRDKGFAPVQEGSDGQVVVAAPPARRARDRRPASRPVVAAVDAELAGRLVTGLRTAEISAQALRSRQEADGPVLEATDPTVTIASLRDAAADQRGVWIGYADNGGRSTTHLFYPSRIEGGRAFGRVADTNDERAFVIHRVTGVASA